MRYIPINKLISKIFADAAGKKAQARLRRAHIKLAGMLPGDRKAHTDRNGPNKWAPIKNHFTGILGKKCWYTEVELIGAPLAVDHYRPVCDYWWLAYDVENYRVSCPWANSPEYNAAHGCAGGKGDSFPLLDPGIRATGKGKLRIERPIILDPCKKRDCDLLAFQADGRPVLNPKYAADPVAVKRVRESLLILNIDHPDFNTKREQLCHAIADDVQAYEELPAGSPARNGILARVKGRLTVNAPFSTAARYYLKHHRHLNWVETLLAAP